MYNYLVFLFYTIATNCSTDMPNGVVTGCDGIKQIKVNYFPKNFACFSQLLSPTRTPQFTNIE